ncbi:hypothetical protein [Synechococcus sp. WH 8016]|uniref:hypothetical protein n=1 Tax=Synechococcus sp. WH 8016 TaxID=166318 RepID=UPI00022D7DA2|nr:hypothetical protein [Synechococcus sp. WH 8016]EHA64106.1 hypothetical protein Syn8016DRAFT_1148 [Synechococcus sp. WH 8016]
MTLSELSAAESAVIAAITNSLYTAEQLARDCETKGLRSQALTEKRVAAEIDLIRTRVRIIFNDMFDAALEADRAGQITNVTYTTHKEIELPTLPKFTSTNRANQSQFSD